MEDRESLAEAETKYDFSAILNLYLDHIRRTGSFFGAHKAAAQILGVGIQRATSLFHDAASSFARQSGLRKEGGGTDALMNDIVAIATSAQSRQHGSKRQS